MRIWKPLAICCASEVLLMRSAIRSESIILWRLAKIGSMRLALLRAAVIAALTFDSVPDASMVSPYFPPSGAVRTTRYRAQPSNWRTISLKPCSVANSCPFASACHCSRPYISFIAAL